MSTSFRRCIFAIGALLVFLEAALPAPCQISLSAAVDLAQQTNSRIKMARADVAKALATLQEAHDVYIPSINGGAGLGESYGYSSNPPTLFTITSQSLVFNYAQWDYIRSARAGLNSAQISLEDAREAVAQDTALAFIAVHHDEQRAEVLRQQSDFASRLLTIEQDRLSAGRDTPIELTTVKLTAANLKLSRLHAEDALAEDREHLARLLGLPVTSVHITGDFPPMPPGNLPDLLNVAAMTPSVSAAFASAHAKQEQAYGDNRFLYRPQILLFLQYNRYATFADSFKQLTSIYGKVGANEEAYGVQITVPILDKARQAKARQSSADASRALHEAENAQLLSLDSRARLGNSIDELQARAEVAELDQQLAQQQLEALITQLNLAANLSGPPLTPKDEQNSRIAERQKYLAVLDANYQLQEAEINLLRQAGRLEDWLRHP